MKKSTKKYMTTKKCKDKLEKKIKINMAERKKFNWNNKQAIAIAYKQVQTKYPKCKRKLSKKKTKKSPKKKTKKSSRKN